MHLFNKKKKNNLPPRRQIERGEGGDRKAAVQSSQHVFRRNRTLTGTSSNRFDSANISSSDFESDRVQAHRLSSQRRKVTGIMTIIFLVVVFIWTIICNFTAVATISFSDTGITKKIDSRRYVDAIQSYLDANPINRFTFFTNSSELTKYVSSRLPEVSNVAVRGMSGIGSTNFSIAMRAPIAGWNINSKQYYVDAAGVPFETNYFGSPLVQIVDNSGVSIKSGSNTAIASKRFLSFVGKVVSSAKSSGYTVTEAVLPTGTARELQVKIKENGFLVKLTIDRSAEEQVSDMAVAIRYFTVHGGSPKYIDVRVKGRAYYI